MIPFPSDPILLREHAYEETKNLELVLYSVDTVCKFAHKPIRDYGLGYFTYEFGPENKLNGMSKSRIIHVHIRQHLNIYFFIWLLLLIVWGMHLRRCLNMLSGVASIHAKKDNHDVELLC